MEKEIIGPGAKFREILTSMKVGEESRFSIPARRSVWSTISNLKLDGKGEWSSTLRKNEGFLLVVRRK